MTWIPMINATAPNGDDLVLSFGEDANEYGEVVAMYGNRTTGEVREQSVSPSQFPKRWRETAKRRMETRHPDENTPRTLITHRSPR